MVRHLDDLLEGQAPELHVHVDELHHLARGERRRWPSGSVRLPRNAKACALSTANADHCKIFHADDLEYAEAIHYWTTPTKKCLDGSGDNCTDYQEWTKAWDEVKGIATMASAAEAPPRARRAARPHAASARRRAPLAALGRPSPGCRRLHRFAHRAPDHVVVQRPTRLHDADRAGVHPPELPDLSRSGVPHCRHPHDPRRGDGDRRRLRSSRCRWPSHGEGGVRQSPTHPPRARADAAVGGLPRQGLLVAGDAGPPAASSTRCSVTRRATASPRRSSRSATCGCRTW